MSISFGIDKLMHFSLFFYILTNLGEGPSEIPLAIMTSDDTHSRTTKLLEDNAYFGMKPSQVKMMKQVIFCKIINSYNLVKFKLL